MQAEVIAIGSELLLGQIVDTNSVFIAKILAENGIELVHTITVGDDLERMVKTIKDATARSQIIITTGGIGPTEDDLTRQAIAEVAGSPLAFQPRLMEQIEALFKRRGFKMTENNRIQAYIPEKAIAIENPKGTAPGFIVEGDGWVTVSLPGVPFEMEFLMENTVIPYLRKKFEIKNQILRYKVLRACGLGESALGLQIKDLMRESKNPTVGTLASLGDIRIRIAAKADDPKEAFELIAKMEAEIRRRLENVIYGVDNETLHGNVAKMVEGSGLRLSVAETVTRGIITQRFGATNSDSFIEGRVLLSENEQRKFLGEKEKEFETLMKEPQELADRLAQRIRYESGSDIALAVFGKVVAEQAKNDWRAETFYSLATSDGLERLEQPLGGELSMIRERASIIAIDMLRKHMQKLKA